METWLIFLLHTFFCHSEFLIFVFSSFFSRTFSVVKCIHNSQSKGLTHRCETQKTGWKWWNSKNSTKGNNISWIQNLESLYLNFKGQSDNQLSSWTDILRWSFYRSTLKVLLVAVYFVDPKEVSVRKMT